MRNEMALLSVVGVIVLISSVSVLGVGGVFGGGTLGLAGGVDQQNQQELPNNLGNNTNEAVENIEIPDPWNSDPIVFDHGDAWSPYDEPEGPPKIPKETQPDEFEYCNRDVVDWRDRKSNGEYRADCDIPNNHLSVFYSDIEIPENNPEPPDDANIELTHGLEDIKSISEITNTAGSNPSDWAATDDLSYITSHSILGFQDHKIQDREWTLGVYRNFQLHDAPVTYQYSYEFRPLDFPDPKSSGVVKDAYIQILGIDGGAIPHFETGQDTTGVLVGSKGDIYNFIDYWLDPKELPDNDRKDPVTQGSGCSAYQLQTQYTYHIEDHGSEIHPSIQGDERNHNLGTYEQRAGGLTVPYTDYSNSDITIQMNGEVWADIYEYEWERNRDKICQTENERFVDTQTVTGPPPGEDCKTVTLSMYDENTKHFLFEGNQHHRQDTVNHSWTHTEEVCDPGRHDIRSTANADVTYEYWDWWDSDNNKDTGGWEYIDDTHHRTDDQIISHSWNAHITDNQDFNIEQTAVEIPDGNGDTRYHVDISINYDLGGTVNDPTTEIPKDRFDDLFLPGIMSFGNETTLQSSFRAYSYADAYTDVFVHGDPDDTSAPYFENVSEFIDYPDQLQTYMFGRNVGPQFVTSGTGTSQEPEIAGWRGSRLSGDPGEVKENAVFTAESPIVHSRYVVKNVPNPLQEMLSFHERHFDIQQSNTKIIEYREPVIPEGGIEYDSDEEEIEVLVLDEKGEPHRYRDVTVSVLSTTLGTKKTNPAGRVRFDTSNLPDVPSVHVKVKGDDPEKLLLSPSKNHYYGDITAYKVVGDSELGGYLINIIQSVMLAIPLVFLYLIWRDYGVGE